MHILESSKMLYGLLKKDKPPDKWLIVEWVEIVELLFY